MDLKNKKVINNSVINILITLSLLSLMGFLLFKTTILKIVLVVISLATFLYFYIVNHKLLTKTDYVVALYILLLNVYSNFTLYNTLSPSKHLLWPAIGLLLAILILNNKLNVWSIIVPFVAVSLFIIIALVRGIENFQQGTFLEVNRIFISKLLFVFVSLIAIINTNKNNRKIGNVLLSFVFLIISFLSESRIGLLVAMIYFIFTVIEQWEISKNSLIARLKNKNNKIIIFLILGLIIIVFLAYLFFASRFGQDGFSSSGRIEIYLSFINELTFKKLLLGFKSTQLDIYGHMHSSFIQMVMGTGLLSLLPLILLVIGGLKLIKQSIFLFGIYLLVILYSLVEGFMFFGIGDLLVLPLMYSSFENNKNLDSN